jgi:cytochrome c1
MRSLFFLLCPPLSLVAGPAVPALPDAKAQPEPGLTLRLNAGGRSDTRAARLVALYVPAGQPVSPFLPGGAFAATWEGDIMAELRAEYTFAAEMRGAFKLTLNGQLVLEGAGDSTAQTMNKTFQLKKGANHLVAEFESDGQQDASLQLKWWAKDFPAEPVPPAVFQHDASDRPLREGMRVREGRVLFAQYRCAVCHAGAELAPELARTAPLFNEPGAKFHEAFLAHWINDPSSIRPHALMPRVFSDGGQNAADLAAYLVSLGKADETAPAPENAPLGGALFANFGCIACHTTPDFEGDDEHRRIPLSHVKAKWQPRALREFLKDPAKDYPHARMPNFRLTDEEAERLTSYLIENAKPEFPQAPKGDATKGATLLVSAGCLSCHAGAPMVGTPKLADLNWTKGCLAPDASARGKAPDFGFAPEQRDALVAFAAGGFDSLKQEAPVEFAERQMANLRCTACHSRDGGPSVWSQLEGEMAVLQSGAPNSDAPPEGGPIASTALPALTWAGEKLQPAWMERFIGGQVNDKPRPWLIGRMPGFAAWAHGIAEGLSLEHGLPVEEGPPKIDVERAKIGEQLLGESGGFNCMQCHALGAKSATAVFEAPGPNLARTAERLREGYYTRWLLHPLRIDPETKMPRFATDDGKTPLSDVLDGDAHAQVDAIWQFLHTVKP